MSRDRQGQSIDARLIWLGPVAVLASLAAVLMVRFIAVAVLQPDPSFKPLTVLPAIVDTTVLVALAVLVFRQVVAGGGNFSGPLLGPLGLLSSGLSFPLDPIRAYKTLAVRVLLVSFLPDIAIAVTEPGRWPYALALATMHVAAWAACVSTLTNLTGKDASR